jgi:cell wall-associated NlpC family hydrolase
LEGSVAHIEDVLLWAIAQKGDRYVFGAEVPTSAADASSWDCSELVEWACAKAGVAPRVLDGAFNQWTQCKRAASLISVGDAMKTRGALLFVGDGTGTGRDAITHVAFSLGDGTTVEARGKKWGVGCWPASNRFDFAARIPGVVYAGSSALAARHRDDALTAATLRKGVRTGMADALNGRARRVRGIASWDRYLQALLDAARKH